ncbi:MAG: FAS1-like dehydratase domain-containing protein [Tepidiformaceae bacterium]
MDEEIQSLITDEHRAAIGAKSEPYQVTVQASEAHRMRDVIGDGDVRYTDETGIAPPYVLASLSTGAPPVKLPQVLPNAILTQQEWRWGRPLKIGEKLTVVSEVVDIRERLGGRYGHSILVMSGTDFVDESGAIVAGTLTTVTQFDPSKRQERE